MNDRADDTPRRAPLDMDADTFRAAGHALVDELADFFEALRRRPVTREATPATIGRLLGDAALPEDGTAAGPLLSETAELLFEHSLHNGHPRFFGYITSSAAPLGALGELLAASVNANCGLWDLSPVASEIERRTIRWLAELIGYSPDCGGLMVSGGNAANLIAFFAARKARADWDIRSGGLGADGARPLALYGSAETHTWIQKAADLAGLGTDAVRWVATDTEQRLDPAALRRQIEADRAAGARPFLAVGTAGTVGTGAIDPLAEIASICREHGLWFHVDGAYGAPAAVLGDDAPVALAGLAGADSVALDPHKWLYSPLEAGCTLVRRPEHLLDAFRFRPAYYRLDEAADTVPKINYYEHGIQNSRGFRALKVWLALRHVGRRGYAAMLREDIALAGRLFDALEAHAEIQARSRHLSIVTFRYVPEDLDPRVPAVAGYLNTLNETLLARVQRGGEAFVSNAVVVDDYLLRACIVNFRTSAADVDALPGIVARAGRAVDAEIRAAALGEAGRPTA